MTILALLSASSENYKEQLNLAQRSAWAACAGTLGVLPSWLREASREGPQHSLAGTHPGVRIVFTA